MGDECAITPGTFCWTELATRDVEAAKKFYTELIGWETEESDIGEGKYTVLKIPGQKCSVGGMMAMDGPQWEGLPSHWMPYIAVNDIDDRAKKCVELGGTVKVPPMDIPTVGRFCVIADPTGAVISLFQGA